MELETIAGGHPGCRAVIYLNPDHERGWGLGPRPNCVRLGLTNALQRPIQLLTNGVVVELDVAQVRLDRGVPRNALDDVHRGVLARELPDCVIVAEER